MNVTFVENQTIGVAQRLFDQAVQLSQLFEIGQMISNGLKERLDEETRRGEGERDEFSPGLANISLGESSSSAEVR